MFRAFVLVKDCEYTLTTRVLSIDSALARPAERACVAALTWPGSFPLVSLDHF